MQQPNILWGQCLSEIQKSLSDDLFRAWFLPTKGIKYENNKLTIEVPSRFYYEWIEDNYIDLLKSVISRVVGEKAQLSYSVVIKKEQPSKSVVLNSNPYPKIAKQEVSISQSHPTEDIKNPFVLPGIKKIQIDPQLNNQYVFDNYIEGDCNRLARSAGWSVAQKPGGTAFNPLFIYGGVGYGKTHLINAVGIKIKELYPEKTVLLVSMERFIQQFTTATRNNNRNDFIHFYQMLDVLLVDDVHFITGKKGTQEVFFHIFNQLHQTGKQVVFTSDTPPSQIPDVEQRLISRFKWGLSAPLSMPDITTKKAILVDKIQKDGLEIDDAILDIIAQKVTHNIRELEGALISIMAQASLNKKVITPELALDILNNFVTVSHKEITIDHIKDLVADYFKIQVEKLESTTRKREVVQARQLAMYFAKQFTNMSLAKIGEAIGKKDHATVLHACKTVNNLYDTDKIFKGYMDDISKKISSTELVY